MGLGFTKTGMDRFKRTEQNYLGLNRRLAAGQIDPDRFEDSLQEMMVVDAQHRYWRLADDGKWYVDNGMTWVRATPPENDDTTAPVPPRRWNELHILGILLIILLFLFDSLGFVFATHREWLQTTQLSGPLSKLALGSPTATEVPSSQDLAAPESEPAVNVQLTPSPEALLGEPTLPRTPVPPLTAAPLGDQAPLLPPSNNPAAAPSIAPLIPITRGSGPGVAPSPVKPGLYVTTLRVDPPAPKRGENVSFYVTFLNTTNAPQASRWVLSLFLPENLTHPFGQTSTDRAATIPVGTSEMPAYGVWKFANTGPCQDIFARVAWLNENGVPAFFTGPEGPLFDQTFTICP